MSMEKPREYCGIFGVYGDPSGEKGAAQLAALGLFALQHRGEEAAGMVVADQGQLTAHHGLGLVSEVFTADVVQKLSGTAAIGHLRYSTAGGGGLQNVQPFLVRYARGQLAVAHNGTIVNANALRQRLEQQGSIFRSTSDTENILHLLAQSKETDFVKRVAGALAEVQGAYSLIMLTETRLVGVRDPLGFRPLVLGERNGKHYLASETCALDILEAKYVREVEPGELVIVDAQGVHSHRIASAASSSSASSAARTAPCVFETIYFSRPDSHVFGRDVYAARKAMGKELARLHPAEADVVIPVPDSGVPAAIGYAEQSGIAFDMALTRSHYVGRSFIQPAQEIRSLSVRLKLASVGAALRGKRVVVVDDSLVRGTTSRKIVQLLRAAGAREVHLRISAPPILSPCFYGIDMPTKDELIAARLDVRAIAEFITVDSLGYLDFAGLRRAVAYQAGQFCEACFSEDYPVPPSDLLLANGGRLPVLP